MIILLTRECQLLDPDGIIDKKDRACRYCHKNKKTLIRTDSTYKESILAKAETFNLFVSNCIISGSAFIEKIITAEDGSTHSSSPEKGQFIFFLKDITSVAEKKYGKSTALEICVDEPIITEDTYEMNSVKLMLPNLEEIPFIAKTIITARDEFLEDLKEERQKYGFKMTSDASSKLKLEAQQKEFFDSQYSSHLNDTNMPVFIFDENKSQKQIAVMYIDENKDINFLGINGTLFQSVHGVISYKNISYIDKPEALTFIPAAENIVDGGNFITIGSDVLSEMLKGILFEAMHMNEGMMEGYKTPASYELEHKNIPSDVEYAVLNFYSDMIEQYVTIYITEEMYEFLVKHLGNIPFDLSKEVENAIQQAVVKKLKQLCEKGLLTESQLEKELQSL